VTPPIRPEPANPFLESSLREREDALRSSIFTATKGPTPAAQATILNHAREAGLPPAVVARQPDAVAAKVRQAPDPAGLRRDTPGLARWLEDPQHATLAREEIPALGKVDRHARRWGPFLPEVGSLLDLASRTAPGRALRTGSRDAAAATGLLGAVFGLADPAAALPWVAEQAAAAKALRQQAPAGVRQYDADNADADVRSDVRRGILDALRGPGRMPGSGLVLDVLDQIGTVLRSPLGFAYRMTEQLPGQAPALAGGVVGGTVGAGVGSAIPILGTAGGAIIGGTQGTLVGGAPLAVGQELLAGLERQGVDVSDPAALAAVFRDPRRVAALREHALRKGLTVAGVNALVAPLAGTFANRARAAAAGRSAVAGGIAADVGVQAAGEGASEAAGQVAAGEKLDMRKVAQATVESLFYSLGEEAVGVARGSTTGDLRAEHAPDPADALREVHDRARAAVDAVRGAETLTALAAAVAEAPTTASVPDRLQRLIETATGDGDGDEASVVYFQSAEWDTYWQGQGESPAQKAAELVGDGGRAYDQARATGAALAIPLGSYVSRVAATPQHLDGLLPFTRTAPDGPTLKEAQDYLAALPGTLKLLGQEVTAADAAARAEPAPDATPDGAAEIGARVTDMLRGAGRDDAESRAGGALWESVFRTLATREGLDAKGLFDRYAPTIRAGKAPVEGHASVQDVRPEFRRLDTPALLARLTAEQQRLEAEQQQAGEGQWTRKDDSGMAWSGTTFSGGKAAMQARYTAGRLTEIETELRARGITGDEIEAARLAPADVAEQSSPVDDDVEFFQAAYHGSPHVFDKFSLHAMGSGEGGQAYGWGLYFAGNKDVALFYRNNLSDDVTISIGGKNAYAVLNEVRNADGDAATAVGALIDARGIARKARELLEKDGEATPGVLKALDKYAKQTTTEASGRLYTVEIPGDDTMLLYDLPLAKQPQIVQDVVRDILKSEGYLRSNDNGPRQLTSAWKSYVNDRGGFIVGGDGQSVYEMLTKARGSEEGASRYLASLGINGIKFLDQGSRASAGKKTYNYVIFDDRLVDIIGFEQRRPKDSGPRGRISFQQDGTTVIDLFKSADRSTFAHESAHFFYRLLDDLATADGASDALKADAATLRAWVGADAGAPLNRDQQEQVARGFEAYLMEGKAPSLALRPIFARFRAWLTRLYQRAANLNVAISDPVRQVFDRMLATDQAIAEAEASTAARPLFRDPAALGVTPEQAARYAQAVAAAHDAATEQLTEVVFRQMRREQSAEWKKLRGPVEDETRGELEAEPAYRVLSVLQRGTWPDGTRVIPEGETIPRLDRKAAAALLADGQRLPPKVAVDEGGLPPDVVAEMLGVADGQTLVTMLATTPRFAVALKERTDATMRDRHGEPLSDLQIRDEARAKVLTAGRDKVLREELKLLFTQHTPAARGLTETVARPIAPARALRDAARQLIGEHTIRDLRPRAWESAVAKAAGDAVRLFAKGDVAGAIAAKESQRLQAAAYRAALEAKADIDAALGEFKKLRRPDKALAKSYDLDVVNAARAVLAAHGLGRADKLPTEYLEPIQRYDPARYAELVPMVEAATRGATGNYKALTVADFRTLAETVAALRTLARAEKTVLIDGQRIDKEAAAAAIVGQLGAVTPVTIARERTHSPTVRERAIRGLLGLRAAMRRMEHWVDTVDGDTPAGGFGGVLRRHFWTPISEAAVTYRARRNDVVAQYVTTLAAIEPSLMPEPIDAREIGHTFANKGELLHAILHTGNESNRSKMLRGGAEEGRPWARALDDGALDTVAWDAFVQRMQASGVLTKADYDFAQAVWDLFESLKPDAQRAHRAMYGHYFAEITAEPVVTPYGTYRGGYVPARTDPFKVATQAIRVDLNETSSAMFPTTGRGFTKSRVEAYAAPMLLNLQSIPAAFDATLRFTYIEPRVKDAMRLLNDRTVQQALDAYDPTVRGDLFRPWLERVASQRVESPGGTGWAWRMFDGFWRGVRRRAGQNILALNVVNALQQTTGVFTAGVKVPLPRLGRALARSVASPRATRAEITRRSAYMRGRLDSNAAELARRIDDLLVNPNAYERLQEYTAQHGHILTGMAQGFVDQATWLGAYDDAVGRGLAEGEAIRAADSAVRETQGSGAAEDVSRFVTGTPFARAFTMFYDYFNMQANLLGSEFTKTLRAQGWRKGSPRLVYVYALGLAIPAVLSEALMRAARGEPLDRDDDDAILDDVLSTVVGGQLSNVARMVPFAGGVVESAYRGFVSGRPDDRVASSAAIQALGRAVKGSVEAVDAARDQRLPTGSEAKDILTLIGLASGLPAAALAKPVGYELDRRAGKAEPTGVLDAARGYTTGYRGTK
jgi:hypothetical protein